MSLYAALDGAASNGWLEALEKVNVRAAKADITLIGYMALSAVTEQGNAAAIRLLARLDRIKIDLDDFNVMIQRAAANNHVAAMIALEELGAICGADCLRAAMFAGHEDATRRVARSISLQNGRYALASMCEEIRANYSYRISRKVYQIVDDLTLVPHRKD